MYIVEIEHCQQLKAPNVLFRKDMHDFFFSHVVFCCMFLTHSANHHSFRGGLSTLTDCTQTVAFHSHFPPLFPPHREQSYLKLFPRHF